MLLSQKGGIFIKRERIFSVKAREIISGRGIPAVEVDVALEGGAVVRASAPSGISVSDYEAIDLRDGMQRYMGKGVLRAVAAVNNLISPLLAGVPVDEQEKIDQLMIDLDGTPNKSRLGSNAMTAVSLAVARGGALVHNLQLYGYLGGKDAVGLPVICSNFISGSKTAGNQLDFEDFLVIPYGFDTFAESIRAVVEMFHILYENLKKRFGLIAQITALAPPLRRNEDAFDLLSEAIEQAGYSGRVGFGIDVASGLLYNADTGLYKLERGVLDRDTLIAYYAELCKRYPILFIEDGLHEDDYDGFALMRERLPTLVVGDDLFATNAARLQKGADMQAANAVLIKINQAGTVSEMLKTTRLADQLGYTLAVSTRSGETEDAHASDIAVGIQARLMKTGCPFRGEMVTKWNRMMEIEAQLGERTRFVGKGLIQAE